jgi:hypothetical protein
MHKRTTGTSPAWWGAGLNCVQDSDLAWLYFVTSILGSLADAETVK